MVEEVILINPQPGDIIIAAIRPEHDARAESETVADALAGQFPDNRVVVLYGVDIKVAASDDGRGLFCENCLPEANQVRITEDDTTV